MRTSKVIPPKGRTKLARHFRKNMNKAESVLWSYLKNRGMGVKFRRQVPVGIYIVGFLSFEIKLLIEADGSQHGDKSHLQKDYKRDLYLKNEGYSILRLWDYDILHHTDESCRIIYEKIQELKTNK